MILDCWKIILDNISNTTLSKFMISNKENLGMIKNNLSRRYNQIKNPKIYVILAYGENLHEDKDSGFSQAFKFINMEKEEIVDFLVGVYRKHSNKMKKEPPIQELLGKESKYTFKRYTYYLMLLTPEIIEFFKHAYSDGQWCGSWKNLDKPRGGHWEYTIVNDHTTILSSNNYHIFIYLSESKYIW